MTVKKSSKLHAKDTSPRDAPSQRADEPREQPRRRRRTGEVQRRSPDRLRLTPAVHRQAELGLRSGDQPRPIGAARGEHRSRAGSRPTRSTPAPPGASWWSTPAVRMRTAGGLKDYRTPKSSRPAITAMTRAVARAAMVCRRRSDFTKGKRPPSV